MKSFHLPLAFAAACAAFVCAPAQASVAIGQPAPDFTLTDLAGQAHRLSDYKGKVVVLEWNNPDCPIVHKHYDSGNIPQLQKWATADGVVWLVINSAAPGKQGGSEEYTPAQIKVWLQQHGAMPTDYFRDPSGAVGHLYKAKTTPDMYVIDAQGNLVYDGAIDSIASADQADIAKATNYVRAALVELQAGQPVAVATSRPYGCPVKYQ